MSFLEMQKMLRHKMIVLKENNPELIMNYLPKTLIKINTIRDVSSTIKGKQFKKIVTYTCYSDISYENLVNGMVRERYSESEEFAILRKAISGISDEYNIYNAYVENCKAQAKEFIAERDKLKSL